MCAWKKQLPVFPLSPQGRYFLCFFWLMSSPSLFAQGEQKRLPNGKKKVVYWVIICIGTKEVKNGKLRNYKSNAR